MPETQSLIKALTPERKKAVYSRHPDANKFATSAFIRGLVGCTKERAKELTLMQSATNGWSSDTRDCALECVEEASK